MNQKVTSKTRSHFCSCLSTTNVEISTQRYNSIQKRFYQKMTKIQMENVSAQKLAVTSHILRKWDKEPQSNQFCIYGRVNIFRQSKLCDGIKPAHTRQLYDVIASLNGAIFSKIIKNGQFTWSLRIFCVVEPERNGILSLKWRIFLPKSTDSFRAKWRCTA